MAFGGSRTFYRIACAIEDAGFEIRDTIMWLYGSGFPKSMNIGLALDKKNSVESKVVNTIKEAQNKWKGWGSCLKPSFEPIIVARKPFKGSLVNNVIEYGVGGLNIDECRVETTDNLNGGAYSKGSYSTEDTVYKLGTKRLEGEYKQPEGRFPANTILTYDENDFDEVCGGFPDTKSGKNGIRQSDGFNLNDYGKGIGIKAGMNNGEYGDSGSAARYFYCAKASKKDRDEGLEYFEQEKVNDGRQTLINNQFQREKTLRKNIHPTVKPTKLMQYLVRLVTPKDGIILDPFMGSGSTGKAVMFENKERNADYKFIGIEKEKEYCDIAEARINYVLNYKEQKGKKNEM